MAVRVRLTRVGSKKNAMWRVVVADQRSPRDGRFIEMIGHYNPQTQPSQIVIDRERLDHWLRQGAQPSNTVRKLMRARNSDTGAATAVAPPEAATTLAAEAEPDAIESEPTAAAEAEEPTVDAKAESATAAGRDAAAGSESALDAGSAPDAESADAEGDAPPSTETGGDDDVPEPDGEPG